MHIYAHSLAARVRAMTRSRSGISRSRLQLQLPNTLTVMYLSEPNLAAAEPPSPQKDGAIYCTVECRGKLGPPQRSVPHLDPPVAHSPQPWNATLTPSTGAQERTLCTIGCATMQAKVPETQPARNAVREPMGSVPVVCNAGDRSWRCLDCYGRRTGVRQLFGFPVCSRFPVLLASY